jgi:hypothetical protein
MSAIKRYGVNEYGLDGDELDRFSRIIGRMDAEYLASSIKPDRAARQQR